jgi:hypothetical protein
MAKEYLVTPVAALPDDAGDGFVEIKETDFATVGQAAMAGDSAIVDDFIIKPGGSIVVEGGDIETAGGFTLNIYKPLRAWRGTDGKQFEDFNAAVSQITIAPADPDNSRIDLIYAVMTEDADAVQETRHAKLDPTDDTSAEADVSVYTRKRNTITITVLAGTPSVTPAAPTPPQALYALMYEVTVPAGADALTGNNIRDIRHNFDTLEEVNERLAVLETEVNTQGQNQHRHKANQVDIENGAGKFSGLTEQQAWQLLGTQDDTTQNDPIFRPEILTPEIAPYLAASGKLGSTGGVDGATPVVLLPVGRVVSFFGSPSRKIEPGSFPSVVESTSINAQIVNKHIDATSNSKSQSLPLGLSDISAIQSDGGGTFEYQSYSTSMVERSRAYQGGKLACAYNSTKIVVMGGASGYGDSAVYEIDTVSGLIAQRVLTGDVPQWFIKGVFPCGDGVNVICCQQPGADAGHNGGKLEWFKINMSTLVSTKFTGTAPGYDAGDVLGTVGTAVIGDLIAPNAIVIMIKTNINGVNFGDNKMWIYHCDSDSFEMFTPVGQNPLTGIGLILNELLVDVDFCMYQSGKGVLVRSRGGAATYTFDYGTRTWSRLNISQPSADFTPKYGNQIWGLTIGHANGRVYLTSETSNVWELTPSSTAPQWRSIGMPVAFGSATSGRGFVGFASLLSGGLPAGDGFALCGRVDNAQRKEIFKFAAGGIIEAACGLTLSGTTTQASFVVEDGYMLPWQVGTVFLNPIGNLPAGSIKLEVQFNGANWIEITRDTVSLVISPTGTPTRRLRITLFGAGTTKPCIASLNETYEQQAGPGLSQLFLQFNAITSGVRYLYIDRDGAITIEATAQPSNPEKCLLMRITPNVGSPTTGAPTPFDFVNKRHIRRKYTATRSGGLTPSIANDLPCLPTFIRGYVKALTTGILSDLTDGNFPVTFNTDIAVAGLATNGDSYIIELECA